MFRRRIPSTYCCVGGGVGDGDDDGNWHGQWGGAVETKPKRRNRIIDSQREEGREKERKKGAANWFRNGLQLNVLLLLLEGHPFAKAKGADEAISSSSSSSVYINTRTQVAEQ